jgi:hypothetical protein
VVQTANAQGMSSRKPDDLLRALSLTGIDKPAQETQSREQSLAALRGDGRSVADHHAEQLVASHTLPGIQEGWSSIAEHQAALWRDTLKVEERPLEAYEEVVAWS